MRIFACLLALFSMATFAEDQTETALVNFNVTLELDGIERAIGQTSQSLDAVADGLKSVGENAHLTTEQQKLLEDTVQNINQLVRVSQDSMQALPQTIEQSAQTINQTSQDFLESLELKIIIIMVAALLVILMAIVGIYWLVLRPMQNGIVNVTGNLSSMANAIKTTSQSLEKCAENQQLIQRQLDKQI
ncbi:hypothetical protein [Vibrio sp. SCSIO 43136]|uniref:hypothetical protein n=1 Tax=Vibrio sp. SCSIO 43136 TaxID=2819101 RepID=UPI0020760E3A|nr:hypothetical protein [Vibrio sp. SCSIO 43136]USD66808.1 hypothetical protein J4N39_19330 [Vibrio sp. SCSIO 43136]